MGDIELQIDNYKAAESHFTAALKIDPNAIHVLNSLAISLRGQHREKEAIDILFNAVKRRPDEQTLHYNLYEFIKVYLGRGTLAGKSARALQKLPVPVQMFYKDYRNRISNFEKYSLYTTTVFWLVAIGVLVWVMSFVQ